MRDYADDDVPELDLPDANRVYRNYLETCRRNGVKPVPRERAQELIAEWAAAFERIGEPLH